ncbi:MAG: glycerol-3-phosphate dehydrogenase/oxidase [Candidatus Omnitrophica bacterium]|nr:glycerol-3-phosphate dehydrogenase/oxidase [Candidatus Omnitrophota bacterium]
MQRDLDWLSAKQFDLLVIGGGIYGACAAWEAALRGLSVALVERGDFGQATSANTQKIVHGGLRYLQSFDVRRMLESIRERRALLRVAPHLVHPLPFLMPINGRGLRSKAAMAAAFLVNDLVSWDRNREMRDPAQHIPRCRVVSRDECLRLAPGIAKEGLTGGALWYDGQIDNSERLTLSFLEGAVDLGAAIANYVRVTKFRLEGKRVTGVEAIDTVTGRRLVVRARVVLNTSGPWVDRVLDLLEAQSVSRKTRLVKAMNLVTRPLTQGVALAVPSAGGSKTRSRLWFMTPWRDRSIVGTAYAPSDGDPEHCRASAADIRNMIDVTNQAYPPAQLTTDDVAFVHVGLVPAARSAAEPDGVALEPHYQIIDHRRQNGIEGLISVVGVKYTTARDVAAKAVDAVLTRLGRPVHSSRSGETPVHGGAISNVRKFLDDAIDRAPGGLGATVVRHLVRGYGCAYPEVLRWLDEDAALGEPLDGSSEVIKAEVVHAVREEMALTLGDVVFRRTDLGSRGDPGEACLRRCAQIMARELGWGPARAAEEVREVQAAFPKRSKAGAHLSVVDAPVGTHEEVAA